MEGSSVIELAQNVFLPALTCVGGWFANAWRSKQKKERDILDNVVQIMEMQKKYIADQDADIKRTRDINKRLEAKLDKKNKSIRKAFNCKFSNEGEGCPVIIEDETSDPCYDKCDNCQFKTSNQNAES